MDKDSIEEILKWAYKKYDEEAVLRTNIRTKTGVLIVVIVTLLSAFSKGFYEVMLTNRIFTIVTAIGLICLFIALGFAIKIYFASKYGGTMMDKLDNPSVIETLNKWKEKSPEVVKNHILEDIIGANKKNRKTNSEKEEEFKIGVYFFCIGFMLVVCLTIFGSYSKAKKEVNHFTNSTKCRKISLDSSKNKYALPLKCDKSTVSDSSKTNNVLKEKIKNGKN